MSLFRKKLKAHRRNERGAHAEVALPIGRYPTRIPTYDWVAIPKPNDPLPPGLVCGGEIETGEIAYIARGTVGDQTPSGFFTKESRMLYVPYGCNEHQLRDFEVLVMDKQDGLSWEKCERGRYPPNSCLEPLPVTDSTYIENMLIGRTCTPLTDGRTNDHITLTLSRFAKTGQNICRPGKIHQSHGCLYVPYSGREYCFRHHEMLMLKISPGKLKDICRYSILKSMEPVATKKSVEKLPLPSKLKKFLEEPPDTTGRINHSDF